MANAQAALVSFMLNAVFGQEAAGPSRVVHITVGAVDSFIFDGESREGPLHMAAAAITAPP